MGGRIHHHVRQILSRYHSLRVEYTKVKCVQDATGSVQATSSADSGYRDAVTSSIKAIAGVAQADIEAIAAQTSIEAVAGVSNTS